MSEVELATALLRIYTETPEVTLEEAPDAEHWMRVAADVTLQRQRAFHEGFREGLASARDHLRPDPFRRPGPVTFATVLNDPTQQLDPDGEVMASVCAYQNEP